MKIKKFNELKESIDSNEYTDNELKAIKAGHKVGDRIYNNYMKQTLTIVRDVESTKGRDDRCTLGAVGENPNAYTKIDYPLKDNYYKATEITNIKNAIIKLSTSMTKKDMKELIYNYIDSI